MVKKYSDLYLQARRALLPSEGENASMAARELLAFASGKSVTAVLADSNLYASEQIEEKLSSYVNRMLAHEPLPYILGQWDFYGISLEVTPDVLIPRDDTMAVTDLALDVLRGREAPRVLDLCCGSGCIGLAIAHQLPDSHLLRTPFAQDAQLPVRGELPGDAGGRKPEVESKIQRLIRQQTIQKVTPQKLMLQKPDLLRSRRKRIPTPPTR